MGEIFGERKILSTEEGAALLADWLFVNVVDDLRDRIAEGDAATRYRLLGLAPLLRKMLMDSQPLANAVRRSYRAIPLNFAAEGYERPAALDLPTASGMHLALAPGGLRRPPSGATVPLKRFIALPVAWSQSGPVTVRDLVRYYANVEGGVHLGTPTSESEFETIMASTTPTMLDLNLGLINMMLGIARATVDAAAPLEEAILDRRPDIRSIGMNSRRPDEWPPVLRDDTLL